MAEIVVLGAGISGHTAALHLRRLLGRTHRVTVVSPNSKWNWIPSNIWVGVGRMTTDDVVFPLAPVYRRKGIDFHQAKAVAIWPQGDADDPRGAVDVEYTGPDEHGRTARLRYDYLINATGPRLRFEATEGLGPDDGRTVSVCTAGHATQAATALDAVIAELRQGRKQTLVIGTGHGTCTCEGAAFEYTFNVDHELREAGVRDLARVVYLSNEAALGDFGVDGMVFEQSGFQTTSELWTGSLFRERGVEAILGAHVSRVTPDAIEYEILDGSTHTLAYDFAMLLPPFGGQPIKAYDASGTDITADLFAPSGFMKVDADYTVKPYEEWRASDAADRDAVRGDGKARRDDDRRPDQTRPGREGSRGVHGDDGSRLRRVRRCRADQGLGCGDDHAPGRPGPPALPHRPRPPRDPRRTRPPRPLGEADASLPVPVQGPGAARLVPDPGVMMPELQMHEPSPGADPVVDLSGAPLPTKQTLNGRQNLLTQFGKFIAFDARIMRMVVKGNKAH